MNISATLSSAIAEVGTPKPVATDSGAAAEAAAAVSASSALVLKVADEAVVEDTGGINAWA
jgi:hypothetical protein